MRSRKLLALLFCLITFPAIAGYMTLLGAGVGSIAPVVSWVSTTDPTFPSSSLTYSGPSLSTMFDSTGKLIYKPNNLLLQSNTFSNAAWIKLTGGTGTAAVVTANAGTDPLGGNTASRLQCDRGAGGTSSDYSLLYQGITPGVQIKTLRSIWVKSNTGSSQAFLIYDGAGRNVGVTNTATTSWQQFALPDGAGTNNISELVIGTRGGTGLYYTGGAQTLDLLIYAAVNAAVTYETSPRTADQVITTSSAYYGPRIDYDPNTLAVKGLLIEEARTNLNIQSESLTNAAWGKYANTSFSTDGTLDPAGATAQKMGITATTGAHGAFPAAAITVVSGSTYSQSFLAKAGTTPYVFFTFGGVTSTHFVTAVFNLTGTADITASQTAVGAGSGTLVSATGKYLGNGWFRLTLVGSITATGVQGTFGIASAATGNSITGTFGEVSFTSAAAGTETVYWAKPQLELGSFATSYIPTAAASVTRAADVVQFTGAALTALQGSAGSAAVEHTSELTTQPGTLRLIGTTSSRALIYGLSDTSAASWNGSVSLNATIGSSGKFSTTARTAAAWSAAGRSIVANGGTVATDANAAFGGVSPAGAWLGSDGGTADWASGWYKSFALYNQRLPDATLQAKSVVGASYAANDNGLRFAFADNDNLPIHWRVAL